MGIMRKIFTKTVKLNEEKLEAIPFDFFFIYEAQDTEKIKEKIKNIA